MRILGDIVDGSGYTRAVFKFYVAFFLEEEKSSRFIGSVIGNSNRY